MDQAGITVGGTNIKRGPVAINTSEWRIYTPEIADSPIRFVSQRIKMNVLQLDKEIMVLGKQVTTFPAGIPEAFDSLNSLFNHSDQRAWFGISYFNENNEIIYYAAAEEIYPGEAEKYGLQRFTIESGEWLIEVIFDWKSNTNNIKNVFHELMEDSRTDDSKPCIEWYQTGEAMLCMMKMKFLKMSN